MHALSTKPESAGSTHTDSRVVTFDDEAFDDVLEAISCATARAILQSVTDEPRTASEIADSVDTSVQNASYHLTNLADAGLVRVCDSPVYSEKGCEMTLYRAVDTELRLETTA
jgi:transcriptional regulator, ArsR family